MAATPCHQLLGVILMFFLLHPFAAKSRPVKFESFENVQKGDVGDGINQVKQFLSAYGYYPGVGMGTEPGPDGFRPDPARSGRVFL
ncbi:hypothetical protein HRI_004429400 [Hibiscus trionum]|uniref:Uncharacterized protein n=1 Tax=Hibiscus trionum TaxID=183268 RepID=A0A9W7MP34_HIBTR|nr:hypothetical protein HRI_004429400 [Hibiscus trionum]